MTEKDQKTEFDVICLSSIIDDEDVNLNMAKLTGKLWPHLLTYPSLQYPTYYSKLNFLKTIYKLLNIL